MAAAAQAQEVMVVGGDRSRKNTIPAGTLTAADIAAASSLTQMQVQQVVSPQHQPTAPTQPVDPQTLLLVEGVAAIKALAKHPQNRGPVFSGVVSGIIAGALTAILAVFWHDQSSGGRVTSRLDEQGAAIKAVRDDQATQAATTRALVEVTGGLIDEGEEDTAWQESAFRALSKGEPIPSRSTSGRNRLRRMMPRQ